MTEYFAKSAMPLQGIDQYTGENIIFQWKTLAWGKMKRHKLSKNNFHPKRLVGFNLLDLYRTNIRHILMQSFI